MLDDIFIAVLAAACVLILAWNFVPSWRDKMRGWSTVLEGLIGTALVYFGQFAGAIQDAQTQGIIPQNWQEYVPFILLAYLVVKRVQTSTPVGWKKPN